MYAAEVLATIEWGTQRWKLQESFPVPYMPRWLWMLELMQTMTPLRGATVNPLWCSPRGHPYPQPCDMGMDSCPAVLAGPHD